MHALAPERSVGYPQQSSHYYGTAYGGQLAFHEFLRKNSDNYQYPRRYIKISLNLTFVNVPISFFRYYYFSKGWKMCICYIWRIIPAIFCTIQYTTYSIQKTH